MGDPDTDDLYMEAVEGFMMLTIFVVSVAIFVYLWIAGGSFLMAAVVWLVIMLIFGVAIGMVATVVGMLIVWWLRARHRFLEERAQAKAAKAAAKSAKIQR
ncbi:hypothetical protein [Bergeriella denitrificans]|nr:hypothetical protein [Bergeriella denitrificans]